MNIYLNKNTGWKFALFVLFLSGIARLPAQDIELPPVSSGLGLFSELSITKVRLLSETEERLNLEVAYEIGNDKTYRIQGQILNARRTPMKAVGSTQSEVSGANGVVDLSFELRPNLDRTTHTEPYVRSGFVKILFVETSADEDSWGDILGTDNPLGEALGEHALYRYDKEWRIGGSNAMIIEVPIRAVGKAVNMRRY